MYGYLGTTSLRVVGLSGALGGGTGRGVGGVTAVTYTLVSRQSRRRAGTRFITRGVPLLRGYPRRCRRCWLDATPPPLPARLLPGRRQLAAAPLPSSPRADREHLRYWQADDPSLLAGRRSPAPTTAAAGWSPPAGRCSPAAAAAAAGWPLRAGRLPFAATGDTAGCSPVARVAATGATAGWRLLAPVATAMISRGRFPAGSRPHHCQI